MSSGIFHKRQMAFVGQKPWHGLGKEVTDESIMTNAGAFLKEAHCDWEVKSEPVHRPDGTVMPKWKVTYAEIEGKRHDLGIVGKKYNPLQNSEAFSFFQPWLDNGLARFETGGYLFGGQKIWALARINLPQQEIAQDDCVERFVMLSNAHDGTKAVRVGFTDIRIVCANTLAAAHRSEESKLIRLRHSENVQTNLEEIRKVMDIANQEFVASAEVFRFLASKEFNHADLVKYVKVVLDLDKEDVSPQGKKLCDKMLSMVFSGLGNDNPAVKDTWWAAYNGFTQLLSHETCRTQENRLNNLWFGKGVSDNQRALDLAVEFASGMAA